MWNKAEENADALREAFEAAAERAAEEAQQATAEALARAEQEYKGAARMRHICRSTTHHTFVSTSMSTSKRANTCLCFNARFSHPVWGAPIERGTPVAHTPSAGMV